MRRAVLTVVLALAACGGGGADDDGADDDGVTDDGSTEQDARPNDGNVGDGTPSVPGSLRFFGTGTGGIDRVEIAVDPAVPADIGAGDFTIDVWVRPSRVGFTYAVACTPGSNGAVGGNVAIDRDRMGNGDNGEFRITIAGTGNATPGTGGGVGVGVGKGATGVGLCGTVDIVDNTWHHVAVTRVASTGVIALYVDGNPDGTVTGPTGDISYRDGATGQPEDKLLVLGAEKHDSGPPSFGGWMDELRLSTTVRYTAAFTPETMPYAVDADTAALYHFDEGDGAALGDVRGLSPGVIKVGSTPTGTVPIWASATPFLM